MKAISVAIVLAFLAAMGIAVANAAEACAPAQMFFDAVSQLEHDEQAVVVKVDDPLVIAKAIGLLPANDELATHGRVDEIVFVIGHRVGVIGFIQGGQNCLYLEGPAKAVTEVYAKATDLVPNADEPDL
jgi:hypothetical protein